MHTASLALLVIEINHLCAQLGHATCCIEQQQQKHCEEALSEQGSLGQPLMQPGQDFAGIQCRQGIAEVTHTCSHDIAAYSCNAVW